MVQLLDVFKIKTMKFFCTILFLFVFEFAMGQVPGTLGFSYKSPLAQSFRFSVSSSGFSTANVTARIINNGVMSVTTSGILWGFSVPTISSYTGITTNGNIAGNEYTNTMTGLAIGGTYYIVAYATNIAGTSYGNVLTYTHGTVTNATTGKTWLAVNLGATAFPTSISDANGYGDLYQWGRLRDGHEKRSSEGTGSTNGNDQPNNGGKFIQLAYWTGNFGLWQGVTGTNNPCPSGFRLPTSQEFSDEINTWNTAGNDKGAFGSVLKLTYAGRRHHTTNDPWQFTGDRGFYYTSTVVNGDRPVALNIRNTVATQLGSDFNGIAFSVRCIKN
jgi:uncharacterized protein (TIGR02145 family)